MKMLESRMNPKQTLVEMRPTLRQLLGTLASPLEHNRACCSARQAIGRRKPHAKASCCWDPAKTKRKRAALRANRTNSNHGQLEPCEEERMRAALRASKSNRQEQISYYRLLMDSGWMTNSCFKVGLTFECCGFVFRSVPES